MQTMKTPINPRELTDMVLRLEIIKTRMLVEDHGFGEKTKARLADLEEERERREREE